MARSKKVGNPGIVDTQRQGITSVAPDRQFNAENQNGRTAAGMGAYGRVDDVSARDFSYGLTSRKGNAKSGDGGTGAGTVKHAAPVTQDRLGPRFAIGVKMPGTQAPEAGLTQRNTRFMPAAINRSNVNFNYGRMG